MSKYARNLAGRFYRRLLADNQPRTIDDAVALAHSDLLLTSKQPIRSLPASGPRETLGWSSARRSTS